MYEFMGYKIISSEACLKRVQKRKHKKRRINKKWEKKYGYKLVPSKDVYVAKNPMMIIGYPTVIEKLIRVIPKKYVPDIAHKTEKGGEPNEG